MFTGAMGWLILLMLLAGIAWLGFKVLQPTDPRVGEWLDAIDPSALDDEGKAQLRHIRRSYERGLRVPAKLATDIARITSRAHRIWAEARADDDFAAFAPVLKEVVRLKREEGAALAAGGEAYDALLDDYEPGATAAQLSGMFGALRPRLVALRQAVLDRPQPAALQGTFDEQAQMMLSQTVARTFGYEMARGRIDKAVHPFSSGSGDDVRITTRTNALDPFNCLYDMPFLFQRFDYIWRYIWFQFKILALSPNSRGFNCLLKGHVVVYDVDYSQ